MEFERGYATSELKDLGPAPDGKTGTTITFKPDPEIFGDLTFDYDTLADRFREMAYLNKGLAITLADERDGRSRDVPASRAASPSTSSGLNQARRPSTRRSTSEESSTHAETTARRSRSRRGRASSTPPARRRSSAATPTTPTTRSAART